MDQTEKQVFEPESEILATGMRDPVTEPLAAARKNMLYGLLWCVGGLLVTFGTYFVAESGGKFLVAHGAIIWGAIQAGKGLFAYLKIKYRNREFASVRRMSVTALCVLLLIGYLSSLSLRLVREKDDFYCLETEQTYHCPEPGLQARIPAGYTPVEESAEPQTDSTYARYDMWTTNGLWAYRIEILIDVFDSGEGLDDLAAYFRQQDSTYYDVEIITASRQETILDRKMYCSEGRRLEIDGVIYALYNMQQRQSLVAVTIVYPEEEYGLQETRRRIEELLGGIRLSPE